MNLTLQKLSKMLMAFLMALFSVWGWGQSTIASNGAEDGTPTLTLSSQGTWTSSSVNTGTPGNQRIKSGSKSFQSGQGGSSGSVVYTSTLTTNGVNISNYTSKSLELWNSSISTTNGNGIDSTVDKLEVYVSETNTFSSTPDVTVNSSSTNVRWGMSGTGVISTTAGTPVVQTYSPADNTTLTGSSAFSKIVVNIPNSWTNVYVKIIAVNNASQEFWCIDDIAIKGTLIPSNPPSVTSNSNLSGTYNTSFNYQVIATDNPTDYSVTSGSLPLGLSLNSTTGVISGTPQEAGTFNFSVTATNAAGSGVGNFSINLAKATQTTTNNTSYSLFTGSANVVLNATTNANKNISYVSSNPSVISIANNNELSIVGAGYATITASALEDANWSAYNATIDVTVTSAIIYQKINSVSDLVDGYYVITNESNEFAVGTPSSPAYIGISVTASGGAIANPSDNIIVKIVSLGNNVYTLQRVQTGNFIGWSSSTTLTAPSAVTTDSQKWTIVYDNTNQYFTIKNNGDTTTSGRFLRYNSSTGDFRAYGSSSTLTNSYSQLYKKLPSIWDGSTWSNGAPSSTTDVVITANYSTNNFPTFTANNIIIKNGGVLEINGTKTIAAADVTVEDGGNLIIKDSGVLNQTGAFKVLKNSASVQNKYAFWSSPVANQNLFTAYANGSSSTAPLYVMSYDPATNLYPTVANDNANFTNNAGKGYSVKVPATNASLVFGGAAQVPNNGTINVALSNAGDGYNLIGNPYPSNISLADFYTANNSAIEPTLWFWDNTTGNVTTQTGNTSVNVGFATFNAQSGTWTEAPNTQSYGSASLNSLGSFAKISQGFIVKSINGTAATFTNAMRTSAAAVTTNKNVNPAEGKYWIRLTTSYGNALTQAITYNQGASDAYDGYDSRAMGMGSDAFYSLAGTEKLVIQGRAPFQINDVVPLGNKHFENGDFTISLSHKEGLFTNGQPIYLHDKQTGTYTNLQSGNYTFAANAGDFTNRFEIVYKLNVLSTNEAEKKSFEVYRDGEDFIVRNQHNIQSVEVFDAAGRKIQHISANSKSVIIKLQTKGVYILKAVSGGKQFTQKIIK
ncbi:putative Ig domain-containing protein [uncultured Chryseobacterium sp.]|uniref:putative Ig domain-containing protein n=1 Tax=uncultured Chryseobacterium sp. TaxID=259322 RepID=UPI0025CFE1D5|nr:putative Ig domain-containing protein [uncultured Chryseobacterium sp.]